MFCLVAVTWYNTHINSDCKNGWCSLHTPRRPLTLDEIGVKFGNAARNGFDGMTKREGQECHWEYLPRVVSNCIANSVKIFGVSQYFHGALDSEPSRARRTGSNPYWPRK